MSNYNLDRFIVKQQQFFHWALREIRAGHKQTHWIWFIFPTFLFGTSQMSRIYAIVDLGEAKAYMQEPYLRENLITITKALLELEESDPMRVMGYPDNLKLLSSMTLFEIAAPEVPEFGMVLDKFYGGMRDQKTIDIIQAQE